MAEAEVTAQYACDRCQIRKISCSRATSGCIRCKNDGIVCTYSRTGVIRRNKRKHDKISSSAHHPIVQGPLHASNCSDLHTEGSTGKPDSVQQSQLAADIELTRERLARSDAMQTSSLGALSSLSDAYAAVWHDGSNFKKAGRQYVLFEERSHEWADAFVRTLTRGRPLAQPAPAAVVEHLRASRPDLVSDRAWLVMYYSIILSFVSSNDATDTSTKEKLRCNLWLAMNDVRLLLEPSEANVQALTILASHVEEFTTPALSAMLVANACRLLQALGISCRRMDSETRERRRMLFWYLNVMDKGLALIFGRSPNFHQAMARDVPMPTVKELRSFQPHSDTPHTQSLFGSHFLRRTMQLSDLIGDIWSCLHEKEVPDDRRVEVISKRLDSWFAETQEILEAAALIEKPVLDAKAATSMDLGIVHNRFQYYWVSLLLKQSSIRWKQQCTKLSKAMLPLLDHMVSDSEESFNGIVWHLVCSPFTPFFHLFGEILSNGQGEANGNKEALAAMERLPTFLAKMSVRNSLAAKLKRIALVFVQHARSIIHPYNSENDPMLPSLDLVLPEPWPSNGNSLDWESFFHYAIGAPTLSPTKGSGEDGEPEDLTAWTNNFMEGAVGDWLGWGEQIP